MYFQQKGAYNHKEIVKSLFGLFIIIHLQSERKIINACKEEEEDRNK